jgi:hypothetical protein
LARKGFPPQRQTTTGVAVQSSSQKTNRQDEGNAGAWARLAQNQMHLAPENQAKTMDEPEHNTAPKVINGRINGRFAKGFSGNPGGSPEATRRLVNKAFLEALAKDFQEGGAQAIAKVRKEQPAAYMKICALLVPREMKVQHSNAIKAMSDEQIEAAIEAIQAMLEQRAGEGSKVIEGTAETIALPAPDVVPDGPNKVMDAADSAVGARKRKPHKVPSPAGT